MARKLVPPAAIALLLVLTLAAPAVSGKGKNAKVHELSGKIAGDANAKVSLEVVVRNREPRKVRNLVYKNIDTFCDQDAEVGFETPVGDRSGKGGKNLGPRVEFDNSFRWVSNPDNPSRTINIVGKVKRRGKKVTGLLEVYFNDFPACKAEGNFVATK